MEIITSYKDLCEEIELLEFLLNDLQRQLNANHKVLWTGKAPSDRSTPCYVPLDKSLAVRRNLLEKEEAIIVEIRQKKEFQAEITARLSRLEGLEYKVFYLHRVEGLKLKDIALQLNYSYIWIKTINSKINREKSIPQLDHTIAK